MPSPELAESVLLAAAACWMAYLAGRESPRPRALLFAALYLAVPSVGLGLQAAGLVAVVEAGKWAAVLVNGGLLASMVLSTRRGDSPTVKALVTAEREIQRRVLRDRAYALAAVVLA